MARKQPYCKKSKPNICSMFLQGACTRGAACPYRHEMPANHQSSSSAPSEETTTTLWVGGMTDAVSESDLRKEMSQYGTIQEIRMLREKKCAFVEFKSRDEAKKALESSTGRVLNGSKLSFNWAKSSSTSTSSHNKKKSTVPTATTNTSSLLVSSLVVPASQPVVSNESVPQGFQVAPSVRKILKEKSTQDVPPPPPPRRHSKYPSTSSNAMGASS